MSRLRAGRAPQPTPDAPPVDGRALLVNFPRRVVLHHFNFKKPVFALEFSPDNRYFAVSHGNHVQVWHTPALRREFSPFVLHRTYTGFQSDVTCLDWTSDSRCACFVVPAGVGRQRHPDHLAVAPGSSWRARRT